MQNRSTRSVTESESTPRITTGLDFLGISSPEILESVPPQPCGGGSMLFNYRKVTTIRNFAFVVPSSLSGPFLMAWEWLRPQTACAAPLAKAGQGLMAAATMGTRAIEKRSPPDARAAHVMTAVEGERSPPNVVALVRAG
jgi:hypothetical protein